MHTRALAFAKTSEGRQQQQVAEPEALPEARREQSCFFFGRQRGARSRASPPAALPAGARDNAPPLDPRRAQLRHAPASERSEGGARGCSRFAAPVRCRSLEGPTRAATPSGAPAGSRDANAPAAARLRGASLQARRATRSRKLQRPTPPTNNALSRTHLALRRRSVGLRAQFCVQWRVVRRLSGAARCWIGERREACQGPQRGGTRVRLPRRQHAWPSP